MTFFKMKSIPRTCFFRTHFILTLYYLQLFETECVLNFYFFYTSKVKIIIKYIEFEWEDAPLVVSVISMGNTITKVA